MRRDQLPPHKTATYVMPAYKAVYVSVPKAACTSLKWLVAGIQGEDPDRFHRSLSREVARSLTIHRRGMFAHTPMLHALGDEQLAAIDESWFVFAVVRHPAARVWSAWQSKFLLREPRWIDEYGSHQPRVPQRSADVLEDFAGFVASIHADRDQPIMRNRHFMSQHDLLGPTPYSRVYETREIPQLLEDLATHLRAHGWEGSLELPRANETPLAAIEAVFAPPVLERIEDVYAADYAQFGYSGPPKTEPGDAFPAAALAEVGRLVERSERIGDLALRAQALAEENKRLRAPPVRERPGPRRRARPPLPPALAAMTDVRALAGAAGSRMELWPRFLNEAGAETVAEIGVYRGAYAAQVLADCPAIGTYYMIDPWRHLDDWNKPANKADDVFDKFFQESMAKTEAWAAKRKVLRGTTTEVIDEIPDGALDFAYVDGDHTLRGITIDLIRVLPKVRRGGWIGGDDFSPSIWQHDEAFEPTLVCPLAVYFAEAIAARVYALPYKQFLIEHTGAGFEFVDLTGRYGNLDLRRQLIRREAPARRPSFARRVARRLRR